MTFIREIRNPYLLDLLLSFFNDQETVRRFKLAPAAKGFHHVYLGGLLEHTLSVVRLLGKVSEHYQDADRDLLIAGGVLHDIGKINELSYDRVIDYSDEGRLIGHLVMGVEMLDRRIAGIENFPPQLAMKLRHILLSHHGLWSSGPQSAQRRLRPLSFISLMTWMQK